MHEQKVTKVVKSRIRWALKGYREEEAIRRPVYKFRNERGEICRCLKIEYAQKSPATCSLLVVSRGARYKSVAPVCNLFISTWLAGSQCDFLRGRVCSEPFVSRGALRFALTAAGSVRALTGKRIDANSITRVGVREHTDGRFGQQLRCNRQFAKDITVALNKRSLCCFH